MSKKRKIIIISILLFIFLIAITSIAILKKPKEDIIDKSDPNYAVNDTRDTEEEVVEEGSIEVETVNINGKEISHLERLTPGQHAAKSSMYEIMHDRIAQDETENKKIVTEEISEATTKFDVFVSVTFSDGTTATYVIGYDDTQSHKFLRCSTLEEYEYFNSEANCG